MIFKYDGNFYNHYINITITNNIDSLDISNDYLIISGNYKIQQFSLSTGTLISTQTIPNSRTNITVSIVKSLNIVVLWKYGEAWANIHQFTNEPNCFAA